MHSPLEIAQNYVQIGIHKVRLSALKMLILGAFAGMFIGFHGGRSHRGEPFRFQTGQCLYFSGGNGDGACGGQ